MSEFQISVFTPSYNRAYTLSKCYEGLKRQTCQDFVWIIVDDGSTDNTEELVKGWIDEKILKKIVYFKQENLGMHGAHNTGHRLLETELYIPCDSDDYLFDTCIEDALRLWNENKDKDYVGIIGLCKDDDGKILAPIPDEFKTTTLYELRYKCKIKGDYKFVVRSDLIKQFPYPMYDDENYVAVGYKFFKIEHNKEWLVLNQPLCCQNYLADGEVTNKVKRYVTAPKGYMVYRNEMMPLMHNLKERLWQATHYVSSAIFAKDRHFLKKANCKFTVLCAIPSGILLNLYIKHKYKVYKQTH